MASIPGGEPPTLDSRLRGNDGRRRAREPHNRHSQNGGNPRQPHRHSRDGGNPRRGNRRWVPACAGTTDGGGAPHNRHSQNSGNPRQPHRHSGIHGSQTAGIHGSHIVIPATAGIHGGGTGDGFPPARERRTAAGAAGIPTIVIPKTAGIHGSHIVIPATAGIHGGGTGDGFPPARERRTAAAHPHNRHSQNSGNPRQPHRHSRDGGNPRRGGGDGFPSPREHGRRRRTPQSSFPKQRESTAATSSFPRRRAAAHPNRHSRDGGNPSLHGAPSRLLKQSVTPSFPARW